MVEKFENNLKKRFNLVDKELEEFAYSFINTGKHQMQRPHREFTNNELKKGYAKAWVRFLPILEEGQFLELRQQQKIE